MVTGKPFGITKIGATIIAMITVGGHEVTRNLSFPSDQTLMHIDVYADYLSTISPQTPSRALRTLLTRGDGKSIRVVSRYTEAYGPYEVMLNKGGINIYTKTMITDLCWSRSTQSEIDRELRHAGRRCDASGNGSRRICTYTGHKREEDLTARIVGHKGRLECYIN